MTPTPPNPSSPPSGSPEQHSLRENSPDAAVARLAARLRTLDTEAVPIGESPGRVLRQAIEADRDSPAADVSAMDGYAIRMADLPLSQPLAVRGESRPGHAPPTPDATAAMRVFTGGIVPAGFDAVIRREDTEEEEHAVRLLEAAKAATAGQNIRRQGENSRQGSEVLPPGTLLNTAAVAAAANFGVTAPLVARPARVTVIVTGDELRSVDQAVEPWQLRDSNGYALAAMFSGQTWIEHVATHSSHDTLDELTTRLQQALAVSDAVVLTGGVSMGDYDHVPAAVTACGGEIVFHRLPLRPGKPILGAASGEGKLILGLPGNPVSAAVCGRRFLMPLLGRLAGRVERACSRVELADPPPQQLPMWWMRLVRIDERGQARLVASRGSGDLVALALSDGFIETPPQEARPETPAGGPWPFWSWRDV